MIRSTPSRSESGNITPASTTMVVSPQVNAIMFMPNSPSPPSGTISSILDSDIRTGTDTLPGGDARGDGSRRFDGSIRRLGAPESYGRDGAGRPNKVPAYVRVTGKL